MESSRVSLAYFGPHGYIEKRHHTERRVREDKVSICEEEASCARELGLPEEIDFAIGGDEVFEEDEC